MKLILTLASFALCLGISPSPAAAEGETYHPLEVGLTWTAKVTATTPAGKTLQGKATREITGTKEIDGKTYFTSVTSIQGVPGFGTFTVYQRREPDGIYSIRESDPEKMEFLEAPIPLAAGKTWDVPAEQGKLNFRVEALEAVTVGETKYENCFKISYRSDSFDFSSYYYAAPGIGNVTERMKVGRGTVIFTHQSLVKKGEGVNTTTPSPESTSATPTTPK